jgi:hypothetical protein
VDPGAWVAVQWDYGERPEGGWRGDGAVCAWLPWSRYADAADALFRVVDAAYQKRSIAISSNIHPSGFDELMPKTLATATIDRLLHHAHVIITEGQDSYRLAQATAGKGVRPLG